MAIAELKTTRLLLRDWRPEDEAPYAALNADPEVMRYLLGPIDREKSDAQIGSFREHFEREGFGRWAVEVPGVAPFIGTVGITRMPYSTPFTPAVEVSWRLARAHWRQGLACEAAQAALAFGFEQAGLAEIVSITVPANLRSQAVMQRLGMTRDVAGDFDHPNVPVGHALQRHVLYRMSKQAWRERSPG
ncbi:GNAT family N-acetyltransferase [Variovorax sp. OV329]|uniref:GNAT family N-acetyltransferase n=1 Tax=Variovorax sp. OV329 TaxID=1882825 RepID=UPI0008E37D73|nr:GNAT family N-acetyltransferase [Variovorax sp. OV329]SFL92682.1 Protein N-acetyltransferase, RimJ/RimL family [Variovorax sp. OV329]